MSLKLGHPVEWDLKSARTTKHLAGTVVAVKLSDGIMLVGGKSFRGVKCQIRDATGKLHWTTTFADREGVYTDGEVSA